GNREHVGAMNCAQSLKVDARRGLVVHSFKVCFDIHGGNYMRNILGLVFAPLLSIINRNHVAGFLYRIWSYFIHNFVVADAFAERVPDMQFQYTSYILPLIVAAIISSLVAIYSWSRRSSLVSAAALAFMAAVITEWSLGYALEIAGANIETKLFWGKIQ